jgi:hypothetical protein
MSKTKEDNMNNIMNNIIIAIADRFIFLMIFLNGLSTPTPAEKEQAVREDIVLILEERKKKDEKALDF